MLTESWNEMLTFNGISTLEILKRNSLGIFILAGKNLAKQHILEIRMTAIFIKTKELVVKLKN